MNALLCEVANLPHRCSLTNKENSKSTLHNAGNPQNSFAMTTSQWHVSGVLWTGINRERCEQQTAVES